MIYCEIVVVDVTLHFLLVCVALECGYRVYQITLTFVSSIAYLFIYMFFHNKLVLEVELLLLQQVTYNEFTQFFFDSSVSTYKFDNSLSLSLSFFSLPNELVNN